VHASTDEVVLAWHAKAAIARPGRQEERLGVIGSSVAKPDHAVSLLLLERGHRLGLEDLDPEAPRLLGHSLGELSATDALGETREVVEPGRGSRLAAQTRPLDQERLDVPRAPSKWPPSARPALLPR